MLYAILWYGEDMWASMKLLVRGKLDDNDYNDPYLKLMSVYPRVPHWWYLSLLGICLALSLGTIYGGGFDLPWWVSLEQPQASCISRLWLTRIDRALSSCVLLSFLSEVISGSLFHGKPLAVLTSLTFSRQILEQNLNLISDYKFGL
jgi:hypothetical protein